MRKKTKEIKKVIEEPEEDWKDPSVSHYDDWSEADKKAYHKRQAEDKEIDAELIRIDKLKKEMGIK